MKERYLERLSAEERDQLHIAMAMPPDDRESFSN